MGVESVSWPWGGAAAAACKMIRLINHVAHTHTQTRVIQHCGGKEKNKKTWPIIIFTTDDLVVVSDRRWIPICSHLVVTVGCVEFAAIYVVVRAGEPSGEGRIFRLDPLWPRWFIGNSQPCLEAFSLSLSPLEFFVFFFYKYETRRTIPFSSVECWASRDRPNVAGGWV
jgi:hypothetical protein